MSLRFAYKPFSVSSFLMVCVLFVACDQSDPSRLMEGDDPGECTDKADNDRDGAFDCDDSDCIGSPDCRTSSADNSSVASSKLKSDDSPEGASATTSKSQAKKRPKKDKKSRQDSLDTLESTKKSGRFPSLSSADDIRPFYVEERGIVALKMTADGQLLGPRLCDSGTSYPYPKPKTGPACDNNIQNLYPMVDLRTGAEIRYDRQRHALVSTDGKVTKCDDSKFKERIATLLPLVSEKFIGIDENNRHIAACIALLMF